ncbi:High-affinity branched-chain amino acid transport ATP-binding protein LivF [Nymphon striatum]|nr:High-affinity branched-chain amino acid transport ATP-binding protein LivF [Nymphon striatum]
MSFDVNVGEVVTLLGRNGMGKTTTINSLMGIIKPHAGSITYDGVEVLGKPSFKMANLGLGLVPEGRQIFPNLSVRENLIATASNHLEMPEPWSKLAQRATSMGNLLSGGEQQMLAVGRALMTNPKLLILDEATEGLAPLIREKIWKALGQIRDSGLSILIIDKNLTDLFKLADRHYIVEKGAVVWTGSSTELQMSEDIQYRYLGV